MMIFQSVLKSPETIRLNELLYGLHEDTPRSEFKDSLYIHLSNTREFLNQQTKPRLYLPGRIIHLIALMPPRLSSLCCFGRQCNLSCKNKNDIEEYKMVRGSIDSFNEIIVTPTMLWDHFPDRYLVELNNLAKDI